MTSSLGWQSNQDCTHQTHQTPLVFPFVSGIIRPWQDRVCIFPCESLGIDANTIFFPGLVCVLLRHRLVESPGSRVTNHKRPRPRLQPATTWAHASLRLGRISNLKLGKLPPPPENRLFGLTKVTYFLGWPSSCGLTLAMPMVLLVVTDQARPRT